MLGIGSAFFRYEFRAVTIALFESLVLGNSNLCSVVGRTVVAVAVAKAKLRRVTTFIEKNRSSVYRVSLAFKVPYIEAPGTMGQVLRYFMIFTKKYL